MLNKLIFVLIAVTLFIFLPVKSAFANTLYLSPADGNISIGKTYTVQVKLKAGNDKVNAVSAFLKYPSDKLEVSWIKYDSSAFSIEAESEYGNGIIKISRGNFSGVGGNANIATIGFIGKSLGQAAVSFVDGSAAPRETDSSDSLDLGGSRGGVYNIGAAFKLKRQSILGESISEEETRLNNTKNAAILTTIILIIGFMVIKKKR
ncbi:MAG: cohesin domain-containing protein [Candidatus Daviesbacteria bacterium]|nr:cohesin domain-containing protein [Candidatus Daviesbacteria bacterium]